ncbi:MAG: SDR family oxidoreductase [Methanoregula sp.]|jgi:NAD(P)-dependent dehydrogenase (short-subunit alcohol dehydrogenase family)|uniref:SDR family oxidoreductase n=1 Tax=Methanoregula sp. TaxID=2052170 RepID=UPI003C1776C3
MRKTKELMDLKDRVAIVTGGAGHIGSTICDTCAEHGARVVIIDFNKEACDERCEAISQEYGTDAFPIVMDLTDEKKLRKVPDKVLKKFGSIDILVNSAMLIEREPLKGWCVDFVDQNSGTWRRELEINLTVPFILAQVCTNALVESHHGSVINISSIYGICGPDLRLYEGTEMGNSAAYAASKGGLVQLTRWMATVLAPRVRVNAITLGGVERGQPESFHTRYVYKTPMQRMATEEDVKGAALFLASDLSAYVTGHNLVVDGGFSTW